MNFEEIDYRIGYLNIHENTDCLPISKNGKLLGIAKFRENHFFIFSIKENRFINTNNNKRSKILFGTSEEPLIIIVNCENSNFSIFKYDKTNSFKNILTTHQKIDL